ncbi:hypothetical protein HQ496_01860 [bacterium]|nr:hypothetical protein [bacterium]
MFNKKNIFRFAFVALLMLAVSTANVAAQESASHTVHIGVSPITVMSVSGDPLPFIVDKSTATDRIVATDASTFYNLTTNIEGVFIQAELDLPMPDGSELWISGLSSLGMTHGKVQLKGGSPLQLISGINRGYENGQAIEYAFIASPDAEDIPLQSRSVTLTIVDRANGRQEQHTQTVYFSTQSFKSSKR